MFSEVAGDKQGSEQNEFSTEACYPLRRRTQVINLRYGSEQTESSTEVCYPLRRRTQVINLRYGSDQTESSTEDEKVIKQKGHAGCGLHGLFVWL